MPEPTTRSPSKPGVFRKLFLVGLFLVACFVCLGTGVLTFNVGAIQSWEYTNSVSFCSDACHAVHPEEPLAYQDSYHARVKCTECHMGRQGTLRGMWLKSSHARHLPEVLFHRYERPLASKSLRPVNESCEMCHWSEASHGDRALELKRFQPDESNTEVLINLVLKTGGALRENGPGHGIHLHIANKVEYIASDDQKQDIRWVRTTLPDGGTVEYNDTSNPLSPAEIATSPKRTMDCSDCHNRAGHPFSSPAKLIDGALADGRLDRTVPYLKAQMLALLSADYPTQEEAVLAAGKLPERYRTTYPEVTDAYLDPIQQAASLAQEMVPRLVFEDPGITWRSFPDNSGHDEFPGCFRCHDGEHLSAEGESIRLHCNICHEIPQIVRGGRPAPEPVVLDVAQPASHLATTFMIDHRFQPNDDCSSCHGEIDFGSDDSSFCSNSACHGRAWPSVDLDPTFAHPTPLEGGHADVWCYQCHTGGQEPTSDCSDCHQPPSQPHLGDSCQDCHSTGTFQGATLPPEEHPIPLTGKHADASCDSCHSDGTPEYVCSNCHRRPGDDDHPDRNDCDSCHTPDDWDREEHDDD